MGDVVIPLIPTQLSTPSCPHLQGAHGVLGLEGEQQLAAFECGAMTPLPAQSLRSERVRA